MNETETTSPHADEGSSSFCREIPYLASGDMFTKGLNVSCRYSSVGKRIRKSLKVTFAAKNSK